MKFLDPNHPFFKSPVVRWLTVLLPLAWGLVELFVTQSPFWGVLFIAAGAYAAWQLFLARGKD